MKLKQKGAMSLITVAIIMMLLTLAGCIFLYAARYGHLPLQELTGKFGRSAAVISKEFGASPAVNSAAQPASQGNSDQGSRKVVTVDAGIRRCMIEGKTVYSDTQCTQSNPTSRDIKLHDNVMSAAKPPAPAEADKAASDSADMRAKMIEKLSK